MIYQCLELIFKRLKFANSKVNLYFSRDKQACERELEYGYYFITFLFE